MIYGNHPTSLSSFSDEELCSQYRMSVWKSLNESERLELLQETCNRAAAARGERGSCKVIFSDLGQNTAGVHSRDVIELNRAMYAEDHLITTYKGNEVIRDAPCPNMEALLTVLHENEHAWQDQVINGEISNADPALAKAYRSNNFDLVPITKEDGTVSLGQTYLSNSDNSQVGYYLYYAQSTERDAHRNSEAMAEKITNYLTEKHGDEPSFEAFRASLQADGYKATMERASLMFQGEDLDTNVNNSLMNHYYGESQPVNSQINLLVEREMESSLQESLSTSNVQDAGTNPVLGGQIGPTDGTAHASGAASEGSGAGVSDDDGGIM